MTPDLITRMISLLEKNGDRIVLADPTSGRAVVVIDLNTYENLISGGVSAQQPALFAAPAYQPPALPPQPVYQPQPVVQQQPQPVYQPQPQYQPAAYVERAALEQTSGRVDERTSGQQSADSTTRQLDNSTTQTLARQDLADLSQEELLDKVNREISAWRNAQDIKREQELQDAVRSAATPSPKTSAKTAPSNMKAPAAPKAKVTPRLEDEERFYLEPIE